MRIDNHLPQKMATPAAATQAQKEVPGEREPDGDSDDRAKVAAQQRQPTQIQSETLGKKVNLLA